jgi:outer membrane receptor for monomeric catechols
MKTSLLIMTLIYSIIAAAQENKTVEYKFSKSVDSAIKRGLKKFDRIKTLYLELSDHKDGYMTTIRDYSKFSRSKKDGIVNSSRYVIAQNARLPVWFKYDEIFYKKENKKVGNKVLIEEKDVEGGGYTIIFNHSGEVLDEYRQQ